MSTIVAWHGATLSDHTAKRDAAAKDGYRFLSLSLYGSTSDPIYAAVMIKRPAIVAQRDWPCMTAAQFQQTFNDQANQGYGPVMIAATGPASDPRFAAVFQPQNPIPLTRHLLKSGDANDGGTLQGMNAQAKTQGLILHWVAAYGDAGDPRYAAIWMPNAGKTLWNTDGVGDSVATYQARFNAQTSAWCRPAFVTLNRSNQYLSLFIDRQIGPWVARHNLTPAGYQAEFDNWTGKGYFPVVVQAAGTDAASARFAALFAQSETETPKQFSATGPVANTSIDNVIKQAMQDSPVRHASLAIVHAGRLVYARGYTMAEPNWPVVQPTTCFRMASVSKTVTALAIFQLIESKALTLGQKLQDILQLKTPGGAAPADNRFGNVTIKHLLEHTSGINPDAFRNGPAVVQAFQQAGHTVSLPVTEAMTDQYIAGLGMVSAPGATQAYNNCGYYLLGRIVAKVRGKSRPIDAYKPFLLAPIGVTRIRRAVSLVANEPTDEARYEDPSLWVGQSQMSPDQPLVPSEYGTEQIEIMEGGGGLTGAATDIARLIAVLMSTKDNASLKRDTITTMLSDGAAVSAAGMGRAGYGFDYLSKLGTDSFYGQKGGSLASSGNVLQLNGDWGFTLSWGGKATAATSWYPDYPTVMNIAKSTGWGSGDLFPQYGMASL
ncbi:MAG TPA: serine hydrolase [Vicinamibacterales bacterium]|nr:serine hydrolase [Vicinamibacterales bacterium]